MRPSLTVKRYCGKASGVTLARKLLQDELYAVLPQSRMHASHAFPGGSTREDTL